MQKRREREGALLKNVKLTHEQRAKWLTVTKKNICSSEESGTEDNNPIIIESVDSISKDERGFPLTQYITNGRISRGRYTFTHFKHHHRVLRLISYSMSV